MIADSSFWKAMAGSGFTLEDEAKKYLRINNLAIEGKPDDLVINTHICRGNYHSDYACTGPYDAVAPYVFAQENVDALYLEYDDERSGGFEPLTQVSPGKKVVLGLITTKSPTLEEPKTPKEPPKTGDNRNAGVYGGLMGLALVGILGARRANRRRKEM